MKAHERLQHEGLGLAAHELFQTETTSRGERILPTYRAAKIAGAVASAIANDDSLDPVDRHVAAAAEFVFENYANWLNETGRR